MGVKFEHARQPPLNVVPEMLSKRRGIDDARVARHALMIVLPSRVSPVRAAGLDRRSAESAFAPILDVGARGLPALWGRSFISIDAKKTAP